MRFQIDLNTPAKIRKKKKFFEQGGGGGRNSRKSVSKIHE